MHDAVNSRRVQAVPNEVAYLFSTALELDLAVNIIVQDRQPLDIEWDGEVAVVADHECNVFMQGMPNTKLIKNVWVQGGDVHNGHIGIKDAPEHLLMDRAGADDLVASFTIHPELPDSLVDQLMVYKIKIDLMSVDILLLAERHDHKTLLPRIFVFGHC